MYSPIEKRAAPGAVHPPTGDGQAASGAVLGELRLTRSKASATLRWALATLAVVGVTSCSNGNGILVAKIYEEAGSGDAGSGTMCVTQNYNVKDMGVDFYILLDHSGQWGSPPPISQMVKWLTDFFIDPNFAGIGVGLATYPVMGGPPDPMCFEKACGAASPPCWCILRSCGCTATTPMDPQGSCQCAQGDTTCDDTLYSPDVGIVRLSEGGGNLQSTIYDSILRPFTNDPAIRPAIQGALNYRAAWEAMPQNEGRRITQVLVASSSSTAACDWRNADSEKLLAGPGKPKTYVVAVNADQDQVELDSLAAAGGTDKSTVVTIRSRSPGSPPVVMPATNPFVDIAEKVRALDGRCEYMLPESLTDLTRVNLLAASGGAPIPRVDDRAACQRAATGWFWDPNQPRRIVACESTCTNTLRTAQPGLATVQYGCPTIAGDARL